MQSAPCERACVNPGIRRVSSIREGTETKKRRPSLKRKHKCRWKRISVWQSANGAWCVARNGSRCRRRNAFGSLKSRKPCS
eukprot:g18677.t1